MADFQCGKHQIPVSDQTGGGHKTYPPDLVIVSDDFSIKAVGEAKTFWTFDKEGKSQFTTNYLSTKFGMLLKYKNWFFENRLIF